ncbi:MAG: hypothetical protein ACJ8F3_21080 [Xanthobacteraceae bacterium]
MQRALMLSAFLAAVGWVGNALADSPQLKGPYGFTGSASCMALRAPATFDPGTFEPLPPGPVPFGWKFNVEGIATFNGDGTGTVKASSMGFHHPALVPGAGSADLHYDFTYTVNDNSWTSEVVDPPGVIGTETSGRRAGQAFKITNFPILSGLISKNASTLTAANLRPQVENITYDNGDSFNRICHRSRVFIDLNPGRGQ